MGVSDVSNAQHLSYAYHGHTRVALYAVFSYSAVRCEVTWHAGKPFRPFSYNKKGICWLSHQFEKLITSKLIYTNHTNHTS